MESVFKIECKSNLVEVPLEKITKVFWNINCALIEGISFSCRWLMIHATVLKALADYIHAETHQDE